MIELGISLVALAAIFYGGIIGAREGLFRAFARCGFGFLAFLVAMRWWYSGTQALAERFTVAQEQVSFTVFWAIYAFLLIPFLAGLKSLSHDFLPSYPLFIERPIGFIFGAVNAAVIASAVLLSFGLNLPKVLPTYDEAKLLAPVHRLAPMLYREAEHRLAKPLADATLLPVVKRPTPEAGLEVHWQ